MKILIADDDRTIHISLSKPFIEKGFEVVNAYNGQDAFDMALKEKPDVLFLDVTMPGMDGRDVCKKIRNTPGSEDIHIIMLTAKNQQFDRLLGFEVGADEYVTKPCDINFLLRDLEKFQQRGPE